MTCANCGNTIQHSTLFYRAGKNRTSFCSRNCSFEAYEGFYSKDEIRKTLKVYTNHEGEAK